MPALRGEGLATVKVVNVTRGASNALSSHLMAFGPDGDLLAVVEAHHLTALRTAAASVLAAQTLDKGSARRLAVFGAGRQAHAQVDAYVDALPIDRITVWARRDDAAQELARLCAAKVGAVRVSSDPMDAVRDAEIVTCATASQVPLILGDRVAPETYFDLVGGFRPTMREVDDAVMARATVVTDTQAALTEAGDLVQPLANGTIRAADVLLLADLLTGAVAPRHGDLTVFKSVGHAAEDLVIAELLLERLGIIPAAAPVAVPDPILARIHHR
jgi:ornithine cyclodeaminase